MGTQTQEAVRERSASLRAYTLVYAVLAVRDSPGAEGQLAALQVLLGGVGGDDAGVPILEYDEPEKSDAAAGYSSSRDVLWFRPYRVFRDEESRKRKTGVVAPMQVLRSDRPLWRSLQRFVKTKRCQAWRGKPVSARKELEEAYSTAYDLIVHKHGKAMVPYRGVLLIGHDPMMDEGLYLIGVRDHEWLVHASPAERAWWLRQPSLLARRLSVGRGADVSALLDEEPSFSGYAGRFEILAHRLLSGYEQPVPEFLFEQYRPWEFSQGMVKVAGGNCHAIVLGAKELGAKDLVSRFSERLAGLARRRMAGMSLPEDVLVVARAGQRVVDEAIRDLASVRPEVAAEWRFVVVDEALLLEMARRHPWLWLLARRSGELDSPQARRLGWGGLGITFVNKSLRQVQQSKHAASRETGAYVRWLQDGLRAKGLVDAE